MRKQQTKEITDQEGSIVLTCTQHGAIPGMRLLARLAKLLGPAAGDLKSIAKVGGTDVLPAVEALLERLDEDSVESLLQEILRCSQVIANKSIKTLDSQDAINDVYSGRYLLLLRSLAFAVQVNYGDFLRGALGSGLNQAPAAPQSESTASPST